jgi:hypothetical protein
MREILSGASNSGQQIQLDHCSGNTLQRFCVSVTGSIGTVVVVVSRVFVGILRRSCSPMIPVDEELAVQHKLQHFMARGK